MTNFFFYIALISVFILTVLVRLPNLNRPLFKHHEYETASTLVFNEVWQQRGFAALKGAPCSTYSGSGNRFCEGLGNFRTPNGDTYYLSHAPLAFYLTYIIGQITGELTVLQVQIFNLFLHLLTLFWLGKIITFLFPSQRFTLVAGLFLYGFAPILLWCHGNSYVHEAVVFPFYYAAIYSFLELLFGRKGNIWYFILFFNIWAAIYTDWLGAMLAAVGGTVALIYYGRSALPLFAICASGAFVVIFTVWQFTELDTLIHFVTYFQQRSALRAGIGSETHSLSFLQLLLGWAKHHFLGFAFIFVVIIGTFLFLKIKKQTLLNVSQALRFTLLVSAITVFLYEVLTLQFCATHDYSVMKSFFPLLLIALYLIGQVQQTLLKTTLLCAITLLNIIQYYFINRIGPISQNGDRYDAVQDIGNQIKKCCTPNDFVLMSGFEMDAQLLYYAKHNIAIISDSTQIAAVLHRHHNTKAIWVQVSNLKIKRISNINIPN